MPDQARTPGPFRPATSAAVTAALVFLVALNLRPALTSVGPLLPQIGPDEQISEGMQGLLGALPLLAFGLASLLVPRLSARIGAERAVLYSLLALAAGILVRSFTGHAGLWIGTLVLGGAIAVGNVLVPAIIKRDYARRVVRATGVYSASLAVTAGLASAVAVPLASASGWRWSLAFWAIPAVAVAVLWVPRTRGALPAPVGPAPGAGVPASVWKQPTAWLVTAFMGLQSTIFYVLVTWLPTIEASSGIAAERTGLHLLAFQIIGIASGLSIPRLMRRPESQVVAAVVGSTPMLVAVVGLLAAPSLSLLWVTLAGCGTGASLVVALSLISLRGRTDLETTQLSGMAQSIGYLVAAAGPVLAGSLAEHTGSWDASLGFVGGLAVVQLLVGLRVGRPRLAQPA